MNTIHPVLKDILLVLAGFLVGTIGTYFVLNSDLYKNILASYNPAPAIPQPSELLNTKDTWIATTTKILVPKTVATKEYYIYINNTADDISYSGKLNENILDKLNQLKSVSTSNQSAALDLLVDLKIMAKNGKSNTVKLEQDLKLLGNANEKTTDTEVKDATLVLVGLGNDFVKNLTDYYRTMDAILSQTGLPDPTLLASFSQKIIKLGDSGTKMNDQGVYLVKLLNKKTEEQVQAKLNTTK